jgi:hypothetical protein
LNFKPPTRKATYFELDEKTKDTLQQIARYRHSTLSNCLEEGARMLIHRESNRIREDMSDLQIVNRMVTH